MIKPLKIYGIFKYLKSKNPINYSKHENVNIMSINVRCIIKCDKYKRNWLYRAAYLKDSIEKESPDIIGFQEATIQQLRYLKSILKNYGYVYKTRDNKIYSETNAIFYNKDLFELVNHDTFYLSKTYNVLSNTWNGKCYRICTFVCLKNKQTNQLIAIFNTHLDHISELARINGIKLIKSRIIDLKYDDISHIIMGDMNDHYGSTTINTLLDGYIDASSFNNYNNIITYNGYGNTNIQEKIDYMALKNVDLVDYKVISNIYEDNVYPTDHNLIKIIIR